MMGKCNTSGGFINKQNKQKHKPNKTEQKNTRVRKYVEFRVRRILIFGRIMKTGHVLSLLFVALAGSKGLFSVTHSAAKCIITREGCSSCRCLS